MADVQTEHGFTKVANRLLEACLFAGFSGTQLKILVALVRMTYGWGRKAIAISAPELAARCGLSSKGGFRRELRDLIAQGVVEVRETGGGREPHTLAVQKDFERWGTFSVGERRLAAMWDDLSTRVAPRAEPDPARSASDKGDDAEDNQQRSSTLTDNGQAPEPITVRGTGAKSAPAQEMRAPKERKEIKERTTSPRAARRGGKTTAKTAAMPPAGKAAKAAASSEARATWMTPYCEAWAAVYGAGAELPVEPNARALRRLEEKHGADEVRARWQRMLAATEPQFASGPMLQKTWPRWDADGGGGTTPRPAGVGVHTPADAYAHAFYALVHEFELDRQVIDRARHRERYEAAAVAYEERFGTAEMGHGRERFRRELAAVEPWVWGPDIRDDHWGQRDALERVRAGLARASAPTAASVSAAPPADYSLSPASRPEPAAV